MVFSTVCPLCKAFMRKKNRRTYECDCGNWMYLYVEPEYLPAVPERDEYYVIQYRSDVEAPADFYPKSNDIYPGYCRRFCNVRNYPACRKTCTWLE